MKTYFEPVIDAVEAVQIMRDLGYDKSTIDGCLKDRWYDKEGLITEKELETYYRLMALEYLIGYRAFRHCNPAMADSQMRRYRACKEYLK